MPLRRPIFCQIRRIDDPSVDCAMAAALPTAGIHDCRLIAHALLERKHPQGMIGLVQHFHLLPDDIQQTLIDNVADLYRPMREAVQQHSRDGPGNVIEIVRRSHATQLAYLVGEQLVHGSQELRRSAAQCLLELAQWAGTDRLPQAPTNCGARAAAYLLTTIQRAVEVYESHCQTDALVAMAAMAPRPMPIACAFLTTSAAARTKALDDLRLMLHRAGSPEICRALPALLTYPTLTSDVLAGLRRTCQSPYLTHMLATVHLLHNRAATCHLANHSAEVNMMPSADYVAQLPNHRQRALIWWLTALSLPPAEQLRQLEQLTNLPDRMAKLIILRRLILLSASKQADAAHDAASRFCFDTDPLLARIALRHLIRCRWSQLPQLLIRLVNTAPPQVRRLAVEKLAPLGFDRLWAAWPQLDHHHRIAAGKAMIKIDANFHRHLADHLNDSDRHVQLRALSMTDELNQGDFFAPLLIALAAGQNSRIVASAVRALGTVHSPQADQALQRALKHHDSRVRANAVEAIQRTSSTQHVHQLTRMAQHEDNRPRANAINALLDMNTANAVDAINTMLDDDRTNHRISALWLVEAVGLLHVATHVAEMSIRDPDTQVRKRAAHVTKQLIQLMQSTHANGTPVPA